ncbi:hypothetical protein [Aureimonas sp. AU40]|uniref:hypothetical protein n=1 Tax=Aureimonas sp. AU40 TaxID=1637747 RepID=UPI000785F21A|nr:hypothetical protein [Aureimonas sp. AU40]
MTHAPFQVERAPTYSVPFFATGFNTWKIRVVGAPADERPFCEVSFQDADTKHPEYAAYMQGVQERVEHVAAVINAGLEAQAKQRAALDI